METGSQKTEARLAERVRRLRGERRLTLDALAERTGVSRSMISLVERAESSPTAAVLERLAAGLGVSLASLFAEGPRADAAPVKRRAEQVAWRDPQSGYVRRNLSPAGYPSPMELVEVTLPAGTHVVYDSVRLSAGISQQIWLLEGRLDLSVGGGVHRLESGDCLAMRVEGPTAFHNPGDVETRYLVALVVDTAPTGHGTGGAGPVGAGSRRRRRAAP